MGKGGEEHSTAEGHVNKTASWEHSGHHYPAANLRGD